uniref:Chitin synthase export chaperone n=1 Tax=Rhabditophanes sp. KR3021 TaxID=114890 RepID=A0AC35TUY2_9BILA
MYSTTTAALLLLFFAYNIPIPYSLGGFEINKDNVTIYPLVLRSSEVYKCKVPPKQYPSGEGNEDVLFDSLLIRINFDKNVKIYFVIAISITCLARLITASRQFGNLKNSNLIKSFPLVYLFPVLSVILPCLQAVLIVLLWFTSYRIDATKFFAILQYFYIFFIQESCLNLAITGVTFHLSNLKKPLPVISFKVGIISLILFVICGIYSNSVTWDYYGSKLCHSKVSMWNGISEVGLLASFYLVSYTHHYTTVTAISTKAFK